MTDFIFLDFKITADGDFSYEIKRHQLLRRRRQWHPTPILLPGKSHGRRSLVGCSPWGRTELDTTKRLHFHINFPLSYSYRDQLLLFMILSLNYVSLLLLSCFSCVQLCATPWTAAYQASPSMGFSRQEHWSGLPFPSPMHESGK